VGRALAHILGHEQRRGWVGVHHHGCASWIQACARRWVCARRYHAQLAGVRRIQALQRARVTRRRLRLHKPHRSRHRLVPAASQRLYSTAPVLMRRVTGSGDKPATALPPPPPPPSPSQVAVAPDLTVVTTATALHRARPKPPRPLADVRLQGRAFDKELRTQCRILCRHCGADAAGGAGGDALPTPTPTPAQQRADVALEWLCRALSLPEAPSQPDDGGGGGGVMARPATAAGGRGGGGAAASDGGVRPATASGVRRRVLSSGGSAQRAGTPGAEEPGWLALRVCGMIGGGVVPRLVELARQPYRLRYV
jgi:hypothetical protein